MKVVKMLEIGRDLLKFMSDNGLRHDDYLYVGMFHEYEYRRRNHEKYSVIVGELSRKYLVSESTVKRIVKRFSKDL